MSQCIVNLGVFRSCRINQIYKGEKMKKKIVLALISTMLATAVTGCGVNPEAYLKPDNNSEEDIVATYEAEEAVLGNGVSIEASLSGFSGSGYAHGFDKEDSSLTFDVEVPKEGTYNLRFTSAGIGGYKENFVSVDGNSIGSLVTESDGVFAKSTLSGVYMTTGKHQVKIEKSWGWIDLDRLEILVDSGIGEGVYVVNPETVNPNATASAKKIKRFLAENYGKKVISGQVCDEGTFGDEYVYIKDVTGEYPAILGLDFMNYSGNAVEHGASAISTDIAKGYWNNYGGIVTFCWHWFAPEQYHSSGEWYKTFYKENTNIDLDKIMNGQDMVGYNLLMADIDRIAEQIKILDEAGVPIMFRPLHEASGGWFWWGDCEAASYKLLYRKIYDKLTNEHGLNNIIWIWNGQDAAWYPGDEYVDIVGTDIYEKEHDYSSRSNYFRKMLDSTEQYNMITAQSECGTLTDIDMMFRDGAIWSYWCTWCDEFCLSEKYTTKEQLKKIYSDDRVINLDDLPSFK